jgi:hypothetical protein
MQTHLKSCHSLNIQPFFSDELKQQIEEYNQRPAKIRAELAKLAESVDTLMQSATSGECDRPDKLAADLTKAHGKLMALKVNLLNTLAAKRELETPMKEAYRVEHDRMKGLENERAGELRKTLEATGMIKTQIHGSILADPTRRRYADEAGRCSTGFNMRVLSDAELSAMDDISNELHRQFQL